MSSYKLPPSPLLMQISNNPSSDNFQSSFKHLNYYIRQLLSQAGFDFQDFSRILDFGCGVGRFFYSFADIVTNKQKLYGTDLDESCVNWCKENLPFARVDKNNLLPPLKYEDGFFSLIYACSVFSHLPIDYQLCWAIEIYRCLSPGGCFLFSTHGVTFFPNFYKHIRKVEKNNSSIISLGASGLFISFESGAENDIGQREVGSAFNKEAMSEIFPFLELKLHVPCSELAGAQDTYVLQKSEQSISPVVCLSTNESDVEMNHRAVFSTKRLNTESIKFEFEANAQRKFHSLVEFSDTYFGKAIANITIHQQDGLVKLSSSKIVATSQILGMGTFYILVFELGMLTGKYSIEITFSGIPKDVKYTIIRPMLY
ncbi:MAG TPA: class I SAM-dependent methyltransferase [Paenisporosarcina sp.]|nr:class I SAM-dependent methyltransferase [Paenisporosarcina sp.]